MHRRNVSLRVRIARLVLLSHLLVSMSIDPRACLAKDDWTPGESMRESMVRILATASIVLERSPYGFLDTCYLGAYLRQGNFSFLTMRLEAGTQYAFIGAGNEPARDLDIIIEDSGGNVVAKDDLPDAVPILEFTPSVTLRYTIKLRLHKADASCFCGMVLMKKGGWNIPIRNLDVATNNVIRNCRNVAAQSAAKFLDVPGEWGMVGTIVPERARSGLSDIRFGNGRRAVVSGGDTVSEDIDLAVYDDARKSQPLAEDKDPDPSPLVAFRSVDFKRYSVYVDNAKSQGATLIMTALLDVP